MPPSTDGPAPSPRVSDAVARLRSAGERVTPARYAVLRVLDAADRSDEHLTAEQIGSKVAEAEPSVHRATVYRSLASLVEVGVVSHVHLGGSAAVYHLTDASDYRLALAEHAGADHTINVTRESLAVAQAHLGMKEGFDIGLEMSGAAPAVTDMIANMNHGGRIALLGLPHQSYELDWGKVITHMITLKGIYGREMYDTWYAMSQMIATSERFRSAVAQVITHRFPAEQWEEAFETARSGQCGKVVLDWS